ncbi:MAG: GTP-sensing pleiotropic transcriptional regulator CodY [Lachnospiraceae bacterium]|nr:GTP-sensing pleiotropic transcriptional regulator CodY [Lachnospiraceae bacterium]
MSSIELLDKTRKIGKLLHNNTRSKVVFNDICKVMKEATASNVLIFSRKGKILGTAAGSHDVFFKEGMGSFVDKTLNERLLGILSTQENVNLETLGFSRSEAGRYRALVAPIIIAGERNGTMFVYREHDDYSIDDIIICEYGATVVGLEIMRSDNEQNANETRKEKDVHAALSSLSATEKSAIIHVFEELGGLEGILITSKIADRVGITRSVIVNALRKFESAGIIESRSSGMKGTYIKIVNEFVFDEMEKLSAEEDEK